MTPEVVVDVGREALWISVILLAPVLLVALAVGLTIALFQAATQIQEMTLTFIPKLFSMFIVLIIAGPWMINVYVEFTTRLYDSIPVLIG